MLSDQEEKKPFVPNFNVNEYLVSFFWRGKRFFLASARKSPTSPPLTTHHHDEIIQEDATCNVGKTLCRSSGSRSG